MHGGGGHWKAQLRAQWESTRRRANAGAQTDALYADAGAQTTRPAYTDGGAQTLLGADDEDARPAPSYASDDEADARLAARIVAPPPAPAKLVLVAPALNDQPPTLAGSTLVEADGKSASARPRLPRSGAPPQTPAAASGAPGPGTTKGAVPAHPPSSQNLHTGRSPPPPYAPPASPLRLAPASHSGSGSGSVSASASSPSRSRKAMSPPVLQSSPSVPVPAPAAAVAAEAPPPAQRERLFIRIPARKRPVPAPAPAPALEPQTPVEQLAPPTRGQMLVQSPPSVPARPPPPAEAVAISGRKRPRARPLDDGSPAKRTLPASNGHSVQVSEPVAGPSRLAAPNGEHVAVEAVRAKRQTRTTKSRVAPLPPPAPTAAVSSYAKVTAPAPARARQWPSLSMTTLPPSAPAAETEPPGPTLSVAEALATPVVELSAPLVEQALSVPVVEQARPLVPRKRTRSPSAAMPEPPRRAHTPTGTHAVAASPAASPAAARNGPGAASPVAAHNGPSGKPPSPAVVPRFAHTEAEHEQIRSWTPPGLSDADLEVYRELERDVREIREGAWGPRLAAALQAKIAERRAEGLEQAPDAAPARDAQAAAGPSTVHPPAPAAVAHAATDSVQAPPIREQATSPKRAPTSASAGPSTVRAPAAPSASLAPATLHSASIREQPTSPKRASTSAPSVSTSPARPKITLRLKLPRAPSPPPAKSPARDKTESPIGMCFPSPPAPPVPVPSRAVPPELLAAFGGPGEEEDVEPTRDAGAHEQPGSQKGTRAPVSEPPESARLEPAAAEQSLALSPAADVRQDDVPATARERSPASRAVSPLPLLLDPAVLADAHARPAEEDVLRESAPRPASAVGVQGGADVDMGMVMDTAEDGAPSARAVSDRAPSLDVLARADSPDPVAAIPSPNDEQDEDADMNMAEDGAPARAPSLAGPAESVSSFSSPGAGDADMGVEEDSVPPPMPATDAPSPPPAAPSAAAPRKRARTPSLEQRALSSPRRSSTPASPSPAPASPLILPSPPPPPQPHTSPPPPQPDPSPKSGPMSPPWSPVALPDEMMQLLTLGGEPLPMPVFDPLPPPPAPDEEDEFNSGVEDEVERMLAVAPPPAEPAGEEGRQVKKRRRRASGRKKSRAVVGDSD